MAENAQARRARLAVVPDQPEQTDPTDVPDRPRAAGRRAADGLSLRFYQVTSADGTRIQAWTNDADGPTVLLCNGLGTNPYAWPSLLRKDCGVKVISWMHRGVGGSERPADPSRVGIDAFLEDAIAVLDDANVSSCVVAGWSLGVNTAFELAVLHPARVTGLFAVAGVPGGTFSSMGAPLMLPRPLRKPIAVGVARTLETGGRLLTPFTTRFPVNALSIQLLTHSGFMLPTEEPAAARRAVREFLRTPVDWYMHLARAMAAHPRVSLSQISVPTAFVSGRWDLLASHHDMASASKRIPGSTYVELPGTHFVQLEHPTTVHDELLGLLARVG